MDYKLEVVMIPVTDVDRAKDFYVEKTGFALDVDFKAENFRVVQLTPPGSACSIILSENAEKAGSILGNHMVVEDAVAARDELAGRGLDITETYHFVDGRQQPGPDPKRAKYGTFASFADPDGNQWLIQEVPPQS
ncbi:VOC family protein [Actinocrispum sp. NPDC049592]|uniref:VOC family protein n=1 Tax=Actinocrispum sp. NPDC049592 TaxID=3154835 RepID=UPI003437CC8F